jgi:polyisoprenyl-phosphate glycosyltransferase
MTPITTPEISVVVPLHNEEANIAELYRRLMAVFSARKESWELICVNDGSNDGTLAALLCLRQNDLRVKIINLSRNFGKDIALSAGIDHAGGDAVIPLDADLQDPPELIGELVDTWHQGFDVVNATRRSRHSDSWLKRSSAALFYRFLNNITSVRIPPNTGDFRLLSRPAIEAVKNMPERARFMKGLFAWVGFTQATVYYDRHPRHSGTTKWNYWQLWNFALDGFTSFSSIPLKVWSYLGLLFSLLSFVYAGFLVLRTVINGIDVPGYASIMVVMLFLGGVQLISLGVLGEYMGRIYDEVKGRPLYIVRDRYGLEERQP